MGFFSSIFKPIANIFKPVINIIENAISWIFPIPEIPDFGDTLPEDYATGVLLNKVSSNASIPIVYGKRKVGGTRIFVETSGSDNQYLYVAFVLCEGEINAIEKIFIDEKELLVGNAYAHGTAQTSTGLRSVIGGTNETQTTTDIIVQPFFGTDDQVASSTLTTLSSWGSTHKLSGLCYLAFRFTWNQDVFGQIPNITAVIEGKKVVAYNSSSVAQTSAYSTNPAWCLLDFLTNERYGKGLTISQIDIPSFYSASVVCATNVTPYSGGSQINIFDINGVIDTSAKVLDNVRDLIKGCRGYLPYTAGKYHLIIETTGSASVTLTENDIIGGIDITGETMNDKYNRVIVNYIDPDENYQANTVQFPPIDDSAEATADKHATMKALDTKVLEGQFDFSKTITNYYQAQEMAEIILRRSRDAIKVGITTSAEATNLAIGDIVGITHSSPSWSAKTFRVIGLNLNEDHTVNLSLIEHNDSIYTWASKPEKSTTPNTTLPNPFSVSAPASVTLDDELIAYNDGTVLTRLNIVVGASTDKFVAQYQVEVKKSGESDFKILAIGSQLIYQMLNVIDNNAYTVRVKAINTLGVSSSYTSATRTIVGATESPEDVTDFSCEVIGNNQIRLTWSAVSDLDISFYSIRYQPVTSGALWSNSTNLIDVPRKNGTSTVVSLMDNVTYMIKAVDKLGNESINELSVVNTISNKQIFNATSLNETTSFNLGTYDSSTLTTDPDDVSIIKLDTKTLFEDTIGNFDSPSGFFELGGTDNTSNPNNFNSNISSSGFYNFYNTFDMGFVGDISFTIKITMNSDNNYDQFDDSPFATFEAHPSPFDGSQGSSCKVVVQVATSTDNNTFSNFHNCTASTYNGRYFKFRIKLQSLDNQTTPQVNAISISADLDQRTVFDDDVASGTSAKVITFPKPFYATPSLNVIGQNMVSGDYYTVTSKTKNGFTINFYNSSNANVNRTFDYQAVGYGVKTA